MSSPIVQASDVFALRPMDRLMLMQLLPKTGTTREMLIVELLMDKLNFTVGEREKWTADLSQYHAEVKTVKMASRAREIIQREITAMENAGKLPWQALGLRKLFLKTPMPEQDESDAVEVVDECDEVCPVCKMKYCECSWPDDMSRQEWIKKQTGGAV
jgi:hypothetical protein